ncbi:DEAD/DEAH box helicase [Rhodocytophaga rosea]|uniref:DEAD/DEAH box helicase n=2 Tax=Rhodocytophaga rosea TaxID=2704465 RepID=A0A6C0GXT2_9BACT|nr:DEAD/DEAH box helicase [Rhodocytophaga rosea]
MGYSFCTPIQQQTIPLILQGKDLIGCAQTGTGKTAAFLIPILEQIISSEGGFVKTLIIVPTRELAKQIDGIIDGLAYHSPVRSIAVYGGGNGEDFSQQQKALDEGADIIIATPGRLIAHLQMGKVKLENLRHVILDEADKMLEMGFYEDIMSIIAKLPTKRQTLLFSATMPAKIRTLAKRILVEPEEITIAMAKPAEGIVQWVCHVYENQKLRVLEHLFKEKQVESMILFTSRKAKVNDIVGSLHRIGLSAQGIHSDKTQQERDATLNDFKNRRFKILVATDILSRGIDVEAISHIVNFEVPDPEDYVHRIGRTARAAATGEAITFVSEKEQYRLARIEKVLGKQIDQIEIPEVLGEVPKYNPTTARPGGKSFKGKKSGSKSKKPFKWKNKPEKN